MAQRPTEAYGALASKLVDLVHAFPVVVAGAVGAFIRVDLAVDTLIAWHADTMEDPDLVQAGGIILAGVGGALVHIDLTARARVALLTLALEGAFCVDALPSMLTRVGTQCTLVHILIAGRPSITRWAGTNGLASHRVGVTVGALVAGVADTGVIQVAQQACSPMGTLAVERGHPVMASGTHKAGSAGTVINVLAAVLPSPAIDADAVVGAVGVVASATILASVGHQLALINVLCTVLTCPFR